MIEPFKLSACIAIKSNSEFNRVDPRRTTMEPKIDGWRIQMDYSSDGASFWTRTNHEANGKLVAVESEFSVDARQVRVDGEAVYLDENGRPDYNFTARCLGSSVDVCVDKQREQEKYLSYVVFDILMLNDEDTRGMPLWKRRQLLEDVLEPDQHVVLMPWMAPTLDNHLKNLEEYEEGSVIKVLSDKYMGRRHKTWLKWKYQPTVDAQIVGYKPGQGKYASLVGAIQFVSEEGVKGFCSGMDDETRVAITNNINYLINTQSWVEIKHFGRLQEGYRHPQFLRFRTDKNV